MKDPAFLFYDGDAARDVSHMNRLERGAYFDLIQAQRKFGGFTMEQIRKILGKDFEEVWPALELILFKTETEKYYIEWVENSIQNRKQHAEKQRKRIQDYWDGKKKKEDTTEIPRNNHGYSLENENENENENEIVIKIESEKIPCKEIVDLFNSKCISFSKVTKLTDSRKTKIKARWSEMGSIETVTTLFEKMESTAFLKGENKENWKATFDWVFENDKNWVKIIEGNYDKNKTNATNQQNSQKPKGSEQQSLLRV
jgi:hypothetical protein